MDVSVPSFIRARLGGAADAVSMVRPLESAAAATPEEEINCLRFIVELQTIETRRRTRRLTTKCQDIVAPRNKAPLLAVDQNQRLRKPGKSSRQGADLTRVVREGTQEGTCNGRWKAEGP